MNSHDVEAPFTLFNDTFRMPYVLAVVKRLYLCPPDSGWHLSRLGTVHEVVLIKESNKRAKVLQWTPDGTAERS